MDWGIEPLESRRLFAASLQDGILSIRGTTQNDRITVDVAAGVSAPSAEQKRYGVSVNGKVQTFAFTEVHKIVVSAGAGDDVVDLNYYTYGVDTAYSEQLVVRVVGSGGTGDDLLYGGGRWTILRGNEGNDLLNAERERRGITLWGGAGRDTLIGSSAHDRILGGDGNDLLLCGRGDDQASGNAGNDRIEGGEGADQLYGGEGRDLINGADGNDSLFGGPGADALRGGAGVDIFNFLMDQRNEARDYQIAADRLYVEIFE